MSFKNSSLMAAIFLFGVFLCAGDTTGQTKTRLPPSVPLSEAVKLAEQYISKQTWDSSGRFLSSANYYVPGQSTSDKPFGEEPYWEFSYEDTQFTPSGRHVIYVSMSKKIIFVGGD